MKPLVWHWGRRGAGPLFAVRLTEALNAIAGQEACLSLAARAELLAGPDAPPCDWREPTYETRLGYAARRLTAPMRVRQAIRRLEILAPDIAICAMPALLDGTMTAALAARHIPYAVVVHDAEAHPGDAFRFRLMGQENLLHGARHLFCLSGHVENGLRARGFGQSGQTLTKLWLPYMGVEMSLDADARAGTTRAPARPDRRPRVLHFGRLLPYKGLDLLADALERLGPDLPFDIRICGEGPDSAALRRLRAMRHVQVEARWFAETELPALFAWADALVLPYREASQSGVAVMGLAAGLRILATAVGGLPEQLAGVEGAMLCAPTAPAIAEALLALAAALREGGTTAPAIRDWRQSWRDLATVMLGVIRGDAAPADTATRLPAPAAWQPASPLPATSGS
ncbi:glycosyltransferase family 4 protein [Acidomonas methanolica]|uniref:Glycosyl/mannosyl transferase n=2 Tax=Acidomonas methanolica TaxID=437 RepID=A0A023DAC1_ACIMT|nr:glycosyltransferase family 4 protein [Acidomonas methanolica]MBU2654200.1 glycosyltransferase family 4 protein [Acidomonas methanolica]TCS29369.1 glycosyltransferase involved in cell wall biosynthesis [Acidomonas methanolica]GAJ30756.1 glycosyl/mannosyl transferase [Acidomonas methanolica NBRC 104435]GEK99444.1 hypothetical protein AME01nite_19430 [Acidomonas methanolica NBRC 104435]